MLSEAADDTDLPSHWLLHERFGVSRQQLAKLLAEVGINVDKSRGNIYEKAICKATGVHVPVEKQSTQLTSNSKKTK